MTGVSGEEPEQLAVTADEPRPGVLVVRVAGWLDLATAPDLESELHDLLEGRDLRTVVLDLGRTEFLGTAGVAVLLRLRRRTLARGWGPPRLAGLTGSARRTLHTLGMLEMFPDADDVLAAEP